MPRRKDKNQEPDAGRAPTGESNPRPETDDAPLPKEPRWLLHDFMEDKQLLKGIAVEGFQGATLGSLLAAIHAVQKGTDAPTPAIRFLCGMAIHDALYDISTEQWVGMRSADGKRETVIEQQRNVETKRDKAFADLKDFVEKWEVRYEEECLGYDCEILHDSESEAKASAKLETLDLAYKLRLSIDRCLAVSPSRLTPDKRRGRHPSRSRMGWRALAIVAAHIITVHRRSALKKRKLLGLSIVSQFENLAQSISEKERIRLGMNVVQQLVVLTKMLSDEERKQLGLEVVSQLARLAKPFSDEEHKQLELEVVEQLARLTKPVSDEEQRLLGLNIVKQLVRLAKWLSGRKWNRLGLKIVACLVRLTKPLTEQERKVLGLNCRRFVFKHRDLFEVPASLRDWPSVNKDLPKHEPKEGTPEARWLESLKSRCPEYHPR